MAFSVRVPFVGELTPRATRVSPSASISFAISVEDPLVVKVAVPPSSKVIVSLTVCGGSFTGFIVMVIVTVFPSKNPSLAL